MRTQILMCMMRYSFIAAYHKNTLGGVFRKHSSAGRNKLNLFLISILLLASMLQKGGCWSYPLFYFSTSFSRRSRVYEILTLIYSKLYPQPLLFPRLLSSIMFWLNHELLSYSFPPFPSLLQSTQDFPLSLPLCLSFTHHLHLAYECHVAVFATSPSDQYLGRRQ